MDFVMFFLFRFREMFRRASLAQHDTAGVLIYLAFPKVAGKVSNAKNERLTIEDCCLIFRKSFLIRIILIIKLQSSIVTRLLPRATFPASWGKQEHII